MTKTQAGSNGSIPSDAILPAIDGADAPLRRAAVNLSQTRLNKGAMSDVVLTDWRNILDQLRSRDQRLNLDIDSIDPNELVTKALDRLKTIPEFAEIDSGRLPLKAASCQELVGRHPTAASRKLDDLITELVSEKCRPLQRRITKVAGEHPFQGRALVKHCLDVLEHVALPKVEHLAARQLHNAAQAAKSLREQQALLPPHLRDRVIPDIERRAERLIEETRRAACMERVVERLRAEKHDIKKTLDERDRCSAEFRRRIATVTELLEKEQRQQHDDDAVASSSAVIPLDGATESDFLSQMIARENVDGIAELAEMHLDALVVQLSGVAKEKYPHVDPDSGIGDLIARLPAEVIASTVTSIVVRSIGSIHTVYQAIKSRDIKTVAGELYDNSEVLVSLGGYRHEALHIQPIEQTLVRFPRRLGIDDEKTYLALRSAFADINPACLFVDAGPGEEDISCIRTLIGFPICVEETNDCLLEATANCYPHPPFLFGLLTDDGQPDEAIKRLFELLDN